MKRMGLTLVVLAMMSATAYYVFTSPNIDRADKLEADVDQLRAQNRALTDKNKRLRQKVVALRDDPRLAERKARQTSGLARPDEVVFQFDQPDQPLEISVELSVHADAVELAGETFSVDELPARLAALDRDIGRAHLRVDFDDAVDALRQQRVRDAVGQSALAPAEFVQAGP